MSRLRAFLQSRIFPRRSAESSQKAHSPGTSSTPAPPPLIARHPLTSELTSDLTALSDRPVPPYLVRPPPRPPSDSTAPTDPSNSPSSSEQPVDTPPDDTDPSPPVPSIISSIYHPHSREASVSRLALDPMSSQISFIHLLRSRTPRPTPSNRSNASYELPTEENEEEEEERFQNSEEQNLREILRVESTVEFRIHRPALLPRHSDPVPLFRYCTAPSWSSFEGGLAPPISRQRRIPFLRSNT
ncbi:hypothetical protein JCM5350_004973 [Sporobolomyces pararoseus]